MKERKEPETWAEALAKKRLEKEENRNLFIEIVKAVFWLSVGNVMGILMAAILSG